MQVHSSGWLTAFILTHLLGNAQGQTHEIQQVSLDSFPTIEVQIWDRNPEAVPDDAWQVFEGDREAVEVQLRAEVGTPKKHRKALILFEDSYFASFDRQREYLKSLLLASLSAFDAKDSVFFATFDWTDASGQALPENRIFRGTKAQVAERVEALSRPRSGSRVHQTTELHAALFEAVSFMGGLPDDPDFDKSVWVFSGEMSNIYNPQHTAESVILTGRQQNIPVYGIRYPRVAPKYNLKTVAEETFGWHIMLDLAISPEDAAADVRNAIVGSLERNAGRGYRFRFESSASPGGKTQVLKVKKASEAGVAETVFHSPSYWAYIQASEQRMAIAFGTAFALLLGGVGLGWRMRILRQRRSVERQAEREQELQRVENERARQQREIDDLKRREEDRLKQEAEGKAQRQMEAAQQASLIRFRNLQRAPQLVAPDGRVFSLGMVTTIGRNTQACQIALEHPTLSREHAVIFFEKLGETELPVDNQRFYLRDNGSTNGSRVNGELVRMPVELKDGDLVQLGSVTFTYRS